MEPCLPIWLSFVKEVNDNRLSILEIGSRPSVDGAPGKRKEFPNAKKYVGFDYYRGVDVDIVGDVHQLSKILNGERFQAIHSHSVIEHLAMPWVAAVEMIKVLDVGGVMFHHVPYVLPMHELPWDFWRVTTETFRVLFPPVMGMEILAIGADDPIKLRKDGLDPGQKNPFDTHICYGFLGAKIRKVRECDLSSFRWPITVKDILGDRSHYPTPDE